MIRRERGARDLGCDVVDGVGIGYEIGERLQTALAKATSRLDRLEAAKEDFETGKRTAAPAPHEGRVEAAQQTSQLPTFDQYVSGFAPQAQAWLRAHPDCVPTQFGGKADMNAKMMRGHYDALSKGLTPNTEPYFKMIEDSIKSEAAAAVTEIATQQPKQPQRIAPAAPPSREPPGAQPTGGTRQVRLTQDEQEAARISFPAMKPNEAYAAYARNKIDLEAEGKLGRTTH
jgi:hypothetical protein